MKVKRVSRIHHRTTTTTLAKKIVTAEIFMRLIRTAIMWYHARSTSICNASSRRAEPRVASMSNRSLVSHDFTWSDCRINLMNFSAITIFLARVVLVVSRGVRPRQTLIHWTCQLLLLKHPSPNIYTLLLVWKTPRANIRARYRRSRCCRFLAHTNQSVILEIFSKLINFINRLFWRFISY